jgi:hypothetical protein
MPPSITPLKSICPHCQQEMSGAAALAYNGEHRPKPGHIMVCANCAGINRFDVSMSLVKVTEDELLLIQQRSTQQYNEITTAQNVVKRRTALRHERTRGKNVH